jgi:exopolysaccharide biosynthesis polyprenyl glycosylphosphotransferase
MLQEREILLRRFQMWVDVLTVFLAYLLTYLLRSTIGEDESSLWQYGILLLLGIPLWILTLYANGVYLPIRTRPYLEILWTIIKSATGTFFMIGTVVFLLKFTDLSRLFFILFALLSFLAVLVEKTLLFMSSHYFHRQSFNLSRLLIVGTGRRAIEFIRKVDSHPEWGFELLGAIDDEPARAIRKVDRLHVMGTLKDIPRIFHEKAVDEVIFVVPRSRLDSLYEAIEDCETEGVNITIAVDLFSTKLARSSVTELDGLPLLHFKTTRAKEWQLLVKRIFDLAVSGLGLLVLSPVLLLTAFLIKVTSPGPVFYKHSRQGFHGRMFTLFKFRTMRGGAHEVLSEVDNLEDMTTPEFRQKKIQWITPVGRFIRKFSIDELPQLINVFIGHMSIVGPRPTVPEEVEKYKTWQRRRFSMKPGITCLWQISGRNKIGFEEWMKLDLEYLDNWSLRLDFIILLRTIPVVLLGSGAY